MKYSRWAVLATVCGLALSSGAGTAHAAVPEAAASSAAQEPAAPLDLPDGFGLTQVPTEPEIVEQNTPTDFVITHTTPQVAGRHHLRIVLPDDYYTAPEKGYPVLYLLHGSPGDPASYFDDYEGVTYSDAINGESGMIIVMPDGGQRSWYSDWLDQNTAAGAQNWETFHIEQIIPFIDANLRTIPTKDKRAIAGISMGGFGAFHYAQRHPELFSQVAALSGDLDFGRDQMVMREVVVASLVAAYEPRVHSDALWGSPYPAFDDHLWNEADPNQNAAAMRGMDISIYIGNGGIPVLDWDLMEFWLHSSSVNMKNALEAENIPVNWYDYGAGANWGDCNGGHNGRCWSESLRHLVPHIKEEFGV